MRMLRNFNHELFKLLHEMRLPRWCYCADTDLTLIVKRPKPRRLCVLDMKTCSECILSGETNKDGGISFAETINYNDEKRPVYIVRTPNPVTGRFAILRYPEEGGNPIPDPPDIPLRLEAETHSWSEFREWECTMRNTTTVGESEKREVPDELWGSV